ncbi:MAG: molecular chaperone DnaK, partial [Planctomycetes bacterium]|nr:molecular chaperone DnaK [Planctomycetota bacterium]
NKLNSESAEEIKKAMEDLTRASSDITKKMYEQASQQGNPSTQKQTGTEGGQQKKGDGENVIDADFETK